MNPRKSEKKKRSRATRLEFQNRVAVAYALLAQSERETDIVKLFQERFDVAVSTAYKYIERARQQIIDDAEHTRSEILAQHLALRNSIIKNAMNESDYALALRTSESIIKTLGYDAPKRAEISLADQLQQHNINSNDIFDISEV